MNTPTTAAAAKFVIYTRVSTDEQGASGLGLDAQSHSCRAYVASVGGVVVREFVEVASGDDDDRPVLGEALKVAKRVRATVLVSKLDRLSRVVAKVAGLIRGGTELRVVECAGASTLELQIRAVIAEEERRKIGERTRDALASAKRNGVKLGSARPNHWKGREHLRRAGAAAGSAAAAAGRRSLRADLYSEALPVASKLRAGGSSLRVIAGELNAKGITTVQGATWKAQSVKRLLEA
mgnify:CR=1 FL=1